MIKMHFTRARGLDGYDNKGVSYHNSSVGTAVFLPKIDAGSKGVMLPYTGTAFLPKIVLAVRGYDN